MNDKDWERLKGKHRKTFKEVLHNCDDQVTVRDLILELVPDNVKNEIVKRFNQKVDKRNAVIDLQRSKANYHKEVTCHKCLEVLKNET